MQLHRSSTVVLFSYLDDIFVLSFVVFWLVFDGKCVLLAAGYCFLYVCIKFIYWTICKDADNILRTHFLRLLTHQQDVFQVRRNRSIW